MARKGRPKKTKIITYQSEETKALMGIFSLILAALFFMSYFVEASAFVLIQKYFGQVTFVFGIFLANLGLYFFRTKWPMARPGALIGQVLLFLSLAALLHTFSSKKDALEAAERGELGGMIGYFLSWEVLIEYFTKSVTIILMLVIFVVSLPLSVAVSLIEFVKLIINGVKWLFGGMRSKKTEDGQEQAVEQNQMDGTRMFGDFGSGNLKLGEHAASPDHKVEPINDPDFARGEINHTHGKGDDSGPKVQIKEDEGKEGAFVNEELQYPDWKLPPTDLLNPPVKKKPTQDNIKQNADVIEQTLQSFGVKAQVVDVLIGPTVTQYALNIALGTKVSKIANLRNDLALALATSANALRIEAPIPGTSYVGIEVPNSERETIVIK